MHKMWLDIRMSTEETLPEFLLACISEDEAKARRRRKRGPFHNRPCPICGSPVTGIGKVGGDEGLRAYHGTGGWWCGLTEEQLDALTVDLGPSPEGVRLLAQCKAYRRIVELHEAWPVLVEQPLTVEPVNAADLSSLAVRASQHIAWLTQQEYRRKFGDEPPTAPILAELGTLFADRPGYREEWRP